MKKILSFVLALVMLLSAYSVFASEDVVLEAQCEELLYLEPAVMLLNGAGKSVSDEELYDIIYAEVYRCIKNKEKTLFLYDYRVDLDFVSEVICNVIFENPDLFYARSAFVYRPTMMGYIYDVDFQYIEHSTEADEKEFRSKVDYILATVLRDGMSDEDKALALHDYIVEHTTYDAVEDGVDIESYTSYSVLMNNLGVCQGYTLAYNLLLGHVGIESKYVSSSAIKHAWSLVKIGGNWYHVDPTWDDPTNVELVLHSNFLLSDAGIIATGHTSWDGDVPVCNDTKYESEEYSFSMVRGAMRYENGMFCYEDWKEISDKDLRPGMQYYLINNKKYITEYVKTKFDGSQREKVDKEYYDHIKEDEEKKHILVPVKYVEGKADLVHFDNISGSELFIKTEVENVETTKITVAYYGEYNRMVGVKTYDVVAHNGYVETVITEGAPEDALSMKIMFLKDGVMPLMEDMEIYK